MDYRVESPEIMRNFLNYLEAVKGHSKKTVNEYFLDLRTFFRFMKIQKGKAPRAADLEDIAIMDVDVDLVKSVTLTDIYDYMSYLSRDRVKQHKSRVARYGLNAASRARKVASIKSFYKYLTLKTSLLEVNPVAELDSPRLKKSLPQYLSLDECVELLSSVEGKNKERDYCILMIFLTCGLRISELAGLNITDISGDHMRVLGKGNKERVVFINEACGEAVKSYMQKRKNIAAMDKNALFISETRRRRISVQTIHHLVKKHIRDAGLDSSKYSSHKLRHTAATLMLQNGVDIRTLQELLGHEHLNTTEIYTHIENSDLRTAAKANPLSKIKIEKK